MQPARRGACHIRDSEAQRLSEGSRRGGRVRWEGVGAVWLTRVAGQRIQIGTAHPNMGGVAHACGRAARWRAG
eukprot:2784675-Prymnesium_polylepis.2